MTFRLLRPRQWPASPATAAERRSSSLPRSRGTGIPLGRSLRGRSLIDRVW